MFSVEYVWNAKQAEDFLKETRKGIANMEPLLHLWLGAYRKEQARIFEAHTVSNPGGSTGDKPWKALTPQYVASKTKRESGFPNAILRLTGRFAESLTSEAGTADTIELISHNKKGWRLTFGSSVEYAPYAGAGRGGSRQAMYFTPGFVNEMKHIANHWLSGLIVKHRQDRRGRD